MRRPTLSTLHLTASYLSGNSLSEMERRLPSVLGRTGPVECPSNNRNTGTHVVMVPERESQKVISDPVIEPDKSITDPELQPGLVKEARIPGVMLRLRKRKVKKHQRRRRNKLRAAINARYKARVEKNKEIAFRVMLKDKIDEVKKFQAEEVVKAHIADVFEPLTPSTWKGKRFPTWYIQELMKNEQLEKRIAERRTQDLISGQPLVFPGETIDEYKSRKAKEQSSQ